MVKSAELHQSRPVIPEANKALLKWLRKICCLPEVILCSNTWVWQDGSNKWGGVTITALYFNHAQLWLIQCKQKPTFPSAPPLLPPWLWHFPGAVCLSLVQPIISLMPPEGSCWSDRRQLGHKAAPSDAAHRLTARHLWRPGWKKRILQRFWA